MALVYLQYFSSIHALLLFFSAHIHKYLLKCVWDIPTVGLSPISGCSTPSLARLPAMSLALVPLCPKSRATQQPALAAGTIEVSMQ